MQDITEEIVSSSQDRVSKLAKRVQDESLCFGCASALYGLTKLFYDLDRNAFDEDHSAELSELRQRCRNAVLSGDQLIYDNAMKRIEQFQKAKDDISLKFFYIKFYDIPLAVQKKAEQDNLRFGARLDTPEMFSSEALIKSSDLWNNVYLITIPYDIMFEIRPDANGWTEDYNTVKKEQRRFTAHEMAHQIFRRFDPDGTKGLDSESNAKLFATELLKFRKYYIDGSSGFPRVKLNQSRLASELKEWFSTKSQTEFSREIAAEIPEWLETVFNNSDKQFMEFI